MLWVDLSGFEGVASENETAGVSEQRPETVVTDVPEGSGLRPYLEKVPQLEVQNVERTLQ